MRRVCSNSDFQEAIVDKGYFSTPLLSQDEVHFLLDNLQKLTPDNNIGNMINGFMVKPEIHLTLFDTNIEYRRKVDKLIRQVFQPHIERMLIDYEIFLCNFSIKPPKTGIIPAHIHQRIVLDPKISPIALWCPLIDTDEVNGALHVLSQSHNILAEKPIPFTAHSFAGFEDKLFEKYMSAIPTKAGESVVFENSLIHGSERNHSSETRIAISVICVPTMVDKIAYFVDRDNPEGDFDVYEIDSTFLLENGVAGFFNPPINSRKIGTTKNTNRQISEEEFVELLSQGDEIRRAIYSGEKDQESSFLMN